MIAQRLGEVEVILSNSRGELCAVDAIEGDCIWGRLEPYSALQTESLVLGVRGVVRWRGQFLFGKRSTERFKEHWELVPAGALSRADFRQQLLIELEEECGIATAQITPFALVGQPPVIDLVCRLQVEGPEFHCGDEHTELIWAEVAPEPQVPGTDWICREVVQ